MTISIRHNHLARECLAEFLGTFILMVFGTGVGAQFVLSRGQLATAVSGSVTWGIGVMMGIYVSGGVSGGHINPAVSVAMAVLGRLPWYKVPFYYVAQCLGSFVASGLVYIVYYEALFAYDGGHRIVQGSNATANIWATYPQPYVSTWTSLGDQVFATGVLMVCVLAISDPRNMQPPNGLFPVSIGLLVMALSMSYSLNCGNAMNPARDLIPRLFTAMAGWHITPLRIRGYNFFWVNVVGPHVGAVLGSYVYQAMVGFHWPDQPRPSLPDEEGNQQPQHDLDPSVGNKSEVKVADGCQVKTVTFEVQSSINSRKFVSEVTNRAFEPDECAGATPVISK